jgi:predicted esterase
MHPKESAESPAKRNTASISEKHPRLTTLHSGRIASHLSDERLLFIHGTLDRIIPADHFTELYQALNYPEH